MAKQKTFKPYHPLHFVILILGKSVRNLEYDPVTQFKFNFFFTWFWALCIVVLFFFPVLYQHNIASLIIQELSIWALFISHFTAVGSAIAGIFAAGREDEIPALAAVKLHTTKIPTNTFMQIVPDDQNNDDGAKTRETHLETSHAPKFDA